MTKTIMLALLLVSMLILYGCTSQELVTPELILPEKCTFPVQIACVDFDVTKDSIAITVLNGAGRDMTIKSVTFSGDAVDGCVVERETPIANREEATFEATNCNIEPSRKGRGVFPMDVVYFWDEDPTAEHSLYGEMLASVR
ncbi:hypothetical protein CMO88_01425 [Candidatus Woesearchaeota archaeon]|nr:hypothetical protein [Candidatus Woesearchaeota archaeon]|tara:strand:+ start:33082 stop:33507 length:426 start_codon:yes stop_codon:yes gene_type:complete